MFSVTSSSLPESTKQMLWITRLTVPCLQHHIKACQHLRLDLTEPRRRCLDNDDADNDDDHLWQKKETERQPHRFETLQTKSHLTGA